MKSMKNIVTVGLIQMKCGSNPQDNLKTALDQIKSAASKGANIVCLPELFLSQYFCQIEDHKYFSLAEPIPGPTAETLSKLASQLSVVIIASLFERRAAGLYHNTATVFDADGKYLGMYRKMHIPDDPLYYEKFYFTPGDLGYKTFATRFGKIGVCICWDQWFPEAARLTALQGAKILFYPTAIGWHPAEKERHGTNQHSAWETIQRSHAIANGVFVAVPNRTGHEAPDGGNGIDFWGNSFIVNPEGKVMAKASEDKDEVLVAELDLSEVERQRTHWPFLRDRRVDSYNEISSRYIER